MKRLTPRQRRFVEVFIRTRNGAESARQAGYKEKRAKQYASELRTDPKFAHVEAELQRRLADKEDQDQIQHEIMTNVLIQRITFNPARLKSSETGKFLPLHELDPEDAQHIASLQETEYKHGGSDDEDEGGEASQAGQTQSVKLTNQLEAIKILGKHNGYFTPRAATGETAPYRAAEEDLSGILDRVRRRTSEPVPGTSNDGTAPSP